MTRVAERVWVPQQHRTTSWPALWTCRRGTSAGGRSSPTDSRSARTARPQAAFASSSRSEGIGTLRFDNLGLGDSEGDWGDGSFSHKVADTVARPCEFMNDSGRDSAPTGRATRSVARPSSPPLRQLASVRGSRGQHRGAATNRLMSSTPTTPSCERIVADGEAPFLIGGKALTLKRHFIEDVRAADLHECIRKLHRALLVMHSPTDNTVGIANASEIFRAARHPRSFVAR